MRASTCRCSSSGVGPAGNGLGIGSPLPTSVRRSPSCSAWTAGTRTSFLAEICDELAFAETRVESNDRQASLLWRIAASSGRELRSRFVLRTVTAVRRLGANPRVPSPSTMTNIREQLEEREREILAPQAAKSGDIRGRLRAGGRRCDPSGLPARSRSHHPLQGVPPPQAQDAGVLRADRRSLPHAADAHARGVADRAQHRQGAAASTRS